LLIEFGAFEVYGVGTVTQFVPRTVPNVGRLSLAKSSGIV
jgi:hypothetical protein